MPGSGPATQVHHIEPQKDKVQVGQLWLNILHVFTGHMKRADHAHNCWTVKFLSEIKYHQCDSSGVSEKHLVACVQVLVSTIVPDILINYN